MKILTVNMVNRPDILTLAHDPVLKKIIDLSDKKKTLSMISQQKV